MVWWRHIIIALMAVSSGLVSASVMAQLVASDEAIASQHAPVESSASTVPANQSVHAGKSKEQLLAELKDVYSPAAPAWWPPAPGWWIALLLFVAMLVVCIQWIRRKRRFRRENNWKKTAIQQHLQLCDLARAGNVPATSVIAEASVLIRRVSLTQLPREQTASLTDDQWLAVLDEIGQTNEYSQGAGRLLTRHPYMRPQDIDRSELDALLKLLKTTIDCAPNTLFANNSHQETTVSRRTGVAYF